ncbi:MAG: hydroxymethylbilane synthase [Lachnospiraceae bacterium]|nr:hydroxymethylbilane synthase [Lachnospiraceae bacterium]
MRIRIGTRKSKLALVQTYLVRDRILEAFPEAEVEIVEISTRGDEQLHRSLTSFGGKGVFTKELEEALKSQEIDLAVHSAKDMPMEFPEGLEIGAVLERADVRDVFVTTTGRRLEELPEGSVVGTSSLRRELQIKEINPRVKVSMLRGNVQTRLGKLRDGLYDGILLAAAGLSRLGMTQEDFFFQYLEPEVFLPAAGQGILAVEVQEGRLAQVLAAIHSLEAERLLLAERSYLGAIGGSCNAPAAAYCRYVEQGLFMQVFFAADGSHGARAEGLLPLAEMGSLEAVRGLGVRLAQEVKKSCKGTEKKVGKVWLVGAGPGDAGLISQKGLELIRRADVLVYDNLISSSLLNEARDDAELIYAGKRSSHHHLRQEETNGLLVEKAHAGKLVVRLKGGDPFIFGRGGEEAEELCQAGVPYGVVPGVSSSYGAAAYAGIPVTHRDFASSFHVITGHESNTKEGLKLDYATLAREEGTLVFLMGLGNLPHITASLMEKGKAPDTPVAVIQSGTTCQQRCVTGTLETIVEQVREAGLQTPAATVVGAVTQLGEKLAWFGEGPLFGARVLLTGTKSMCEKQAAVLREAGAEPVSFSLIRTEAMESPKLAQVFQRLEDYHWVVFTSSNGVEIFFSCLKNQGLDIRRLSQIKIAVIGEGTREALLERGIWPDFVPEKFSSRDLAREWIPLLKVQEGGEAPRVLLMRAQEASLELTQALEENEIPYEAVALYRTAVDGRKAEELNRILPDMDYLTLASASAVRAFAGMTKEMKGLPRVICIGPVTERAARKAGIPVHATAEVYTAEGIRDAICGDWMEKRISP